MSGVLFRFYLVNLHGSGFLYIIIPIYFKAHVLLSEAREDHDGDLPFDTIAIDRFRRAGPDESVRSAFR